MTTLLFIALAYALTFALLALEFRQTAPADRRSWIRQQAPLLACTLPATAAVALFSLADTTPIPGEVVLVAPVAAAVAFLLALSS